MATFSPKRNDTRAKRIANRLTTDLSSVEFSAAQPYGLCEYLDQYAKMSHEESMSLMNSLTISKTPFDMLRLAYALANYDRDEWAKQAYKVTAHAKILKIGLLDESETKPKLSVTFLIVSSRYAGAIKHMTCSLAEAVYIQKKIYCGRTKRLQGRSLLELTGCVCTVVICGEAVVAVTAVPAEKTINKKLGSDRVLAEVKCPHATSCALCRKGRSECRLAVHL